MEERPQFGSGEEEDAVLNRLRLLEKIYDPVSIRHLETIGIAKGWKCLEVGAGAGSIAQWLSIQAGPGGNIVATDLNPRFLQKMSIPQVEIRRHDIMNDPLESDHYDVVHCRTLLMWLREPEKALRRMADAVRPGGWLVVEESDYGSILSADATNPSATGFCSTWRAGIDFLRKKGIADPYFGRRLRSLIEGLGFTGVMQEGWSRMVRGGEPMARFDEAAMQMGARPMMAAGLLIQEQFEGMQKFFHDPGFEYPGLTMFSAWGRKPGER